MVFTDDGVDLPEELLQSLSTNQLVVFVGAGASFRAYQEQPANSYYPDFRGLAHEISTRLGLALSESDRKNLEDGFIDRLLGDWDTNAGEVREHAAAILKSNESIKRISLHQAI